MFDIVKARGAPVDGVLLVIDRIKAKPSRTLYLVVARGSLLQHIVLLAPRVGLEPTTFRLTAECSAD